MRFVKSLAVVLMVGCLVVSANAEDKPAKGKGKKNPAPARGGFSVQVMKMLEGVNLTDDQTAKIKEVAAKAQAESEKIRKEGGIGPEIAKAQAEARKKAAEEGKKGKELQDAVKSAVALNADQMAAMKSADTVLAKARKDIFAVLTEEQQKALPEQAQKALSGPAEKGAPKKKNAA